MLKIITSVVLSLVTIMAVTMFAVTVPAQSQKIDDNAAAIQSTETYIKTVDDALENVQEALDNIDLYRHDLFIKKITEGANLCLTIYSNKIDKIDTFDKLFNVLTSSYTSGSYGQNISVSGVVSGNIVEYMTISNAGYPGATFSFYVIYRTDLGTGQLNIDNTFTFSDTVNIAFFK